MGELDGQTTHRLRWLAQGLRRAGLKVEISDDIVAWLRTHVALVNPIAHAVYLADGDNYRLARTRDGVVLMVRAVREGFRVLRALDVSITPASYRLLQWIPEPILVSGLRRLLGSPFAEIGLAGHANAARDEFKQLADEFRGLARAAGVPTPAMDQLYLYIDPAVQPVAEGSARIPMDWRGIWAGLGMLALTGITASLFLLRERRRRSRSPR
jgi:2-dehydropantoate 2-reductase